MTKIIFKLYRPTYIQKLQGTYTELFCSVFNCKNWLSHCRSLGSVLTADYWAHCYSFGLWMQTLSPIMQKN